jgi:hypothetical protein
MSRSTVAVNTMLNVESMTIAADGQSAELRAEVIEEMSIAGQSLRMSSQQTAVLGLVGGQPRYTRLPARITGGQ